MSDDTDQLRFGDEGELEEATEEEPATDNLKDDGSPMGRFESKGGYNIFDLSSYLQKCVRRSDHEGAGFAAWELCRSGFHGMYWRRILTIAIEDVAVSDSVASTILDLHRLATGQVDAVDGWESTESRGRICAMRAAVACAQATSGRLTEYMNDSFKRIAEERVVAAEEGRNPTHNFPAGDLEPGGKHDVVLDSHTASGSSRGRDYGYFLVHASRTDHLSESESRYKRMNLELVEAEDDNAHSFSEEEINHALTPVESEEPWDEPDLSQETLDSE